jgi:hypothetical protein
LLNYEQGFLEKFLLNVKICNVQPKMKSIC